MCGYLKASAMTRALRERDGGQFLYQLLPGYVDRGVGDEGCGLDLSSVSTTASGAYFSYPHIGCAPECQKEKEYEDFVVFLRGPWLMR
jgi:hypothetical protein